MKLIHIPELQAGIKACCLMLLWAPPPLGKNYLPPPAPHHGTCPVAWSSRKSLWGPAKPAHSPMCPWTVFPRRRVELIKPGSGSPRPGTDRGMYWTHKAGTTKHHHQELADTAPEPLLSLCTTESSKMRNMKLYLPQTTHRQQGSQGKTRGRRSPASHKLQTPVFYQLCSGLTLGLKCTVKHRKLTLDLSVCCSVLSERERGL